MGAVAVEIPAWFRAQMRRLIGLKFAPADLTTHWESMRHVEEPLVAAAVARAQGVCSSFPAPWMLLSYAEQARPRVSPQPDDRGVELDEPVVLGTLPTGTPIIATREWRYYCDECSDQGMRSLWCGPSPSPRFPWLTLRSCGRRECVYPHDWSEACPCAKTNPAVLKRKERQRQLQTRGPEHE